MLREPSADRRSPSVGTSRLFLGSDLPSLVANALGVSALMLSKLMEQPVTLTDPE